MKHHNLLKIKHLYLKIPAAILVGLLIAGAGGFLWLRTSLPQLSGTVTVAGLGRDAEILYDSAGIPHIAAATPEDAYFALGFAHAGDRLFQMDLMRRSGAGRLSEIVGPATVGLDSTMRTLGIYALAEETYRRLPADAQRFTEAYAAGVNAFLTTHPGALPPEFIALGYRPEPWRPADCFVWARLMALRLAGNWRTEALRAALAGRLSAAQIDDLWPAGDGATPPTVGASTAPMPGGARFASLFGGPLRDLPRDLRQVSASNSWAVAGRLTASGKPLLANDPHLGYEAPGLWYPVRLTAPGLDLTGATVAGVPFHVLGHTDRFAWAFTTTGSDTQDLFIERVTGGHPDQYDSPDGPQPFATRVERIAVRGGEAVALTVRTTRHGPVISDVNRRLTAGLGPGYVVALQAMALRPDDLTPLALLDMNRARNWAGFHAALRNFHAPQMNVSYADTDGNIGFFAPGRVPVRRSGDGSVPAMGWTGASDWAGTIPFDELPHSFNPASGRIVSANHSIVPSGYKWYLTRDWADDYRARRIHDRLDAVRPQTPDTAAALQTDVLSEVAIDLLPLLLARLHPPDGRTRAAATLLDGWDRRMTRDAAAPLVFTAWLAEVNRGLYADELGVFFDGYFALHPRVVARMLTRSPGWCDDRGTPVTETCDAVVTAALVRALDRIAARQGNDMARWRWGEAHRAEFRHPVLGRIPLIRRFADIAVEADGGDDTVNRGQSRIGDERAPFAAIHGPGYRAIYDLSDLAASRFAVAMGPSGNFLSPRYANTTADWRDGKYLRIAPSRAAALKGAMGVLRLRPAP